jgi:hypothetical protein
MQPVSPDRMKSITEQFGSQQFTLVKAFPRDTVQSSPIKANQGSRMCIVGFDGPLDKRPRFPFIGFLAQ